MTRTEDYKKWIAEEQSDSAAERAYSAALAMQLSELRDVNEKLELEVRQLRYDYAELRTHVERYFVALTALSSLQEVKRAKDDERDAIATHLDRVVP